MKVAVITCYHDPDYVRARSLRAAVQHVEGAGLLVCKNTQKGLLRYPEMLWKVLWLRLRQRPDVYLLTFRGFELLPWTGLISWPKPLIFDEFINPLEGLTEPGTQKKARHLPLGPSVWLYKLFLKRAKIILADTEVHAQYSAQLLALDSSRFAALPVGTDEAVFKPRPHKAAKGTFKVFYYGTMLPLHGLTYVIEAAELLKDENIEFRLVGGGSHVQRMIEQARAAGAHITYEAWVPFAQLPDAIAQADLCLAGPFGNTPQAQHVITGKAYQFLACAAPTLIGESKATTEFADKQNCLACPQADAAALAETIRWASANRTQLPAIGEAGRELFDARFTDKQIAKLLRVVLNRAANA